MDKIVTNDFKRDKHSKALVATNKRALDKYKKQKQLADLVNEQTKHINTLETQMSDLQAQMQKLLEQNNNGN